MQETAFLKVTQNIFAASSDVLLELTEPRAVVHLFSLRHILFFFLGSPIWRPGFLKLLPELIAKLLPEQCPRRWRIAFCGERRTNRWTRLTRMAKEMERAGGSLSAWEGEADTAAAARHTTMEVSGVLTSGCLKQENFREAQGRKE